MARQKRTGAPAEAGVGMSPDRISQRLTNAIETLDYIAGLLGEDDPEASADVAAVACDLAELKLESERETFRRHAA